MTSPAPLAVLIDPLLDIARAAGRAILEHYHPEVTRADKADGSPVTAADHASEAVIIPGLMGLTPDIPVVAEEAFAQGRVPDVSKGSFWLVDPLDGTKEFLKANGEFTVNIGLVRDRTPILGVLLVPTTGEIFWGIAAPGEPTVAQGQAKKDAPKKLAVRAMPASGAVVLASRSHSNSEALAEYLADKKVAEIRISGSAVKFARVAQGVADLYPRLGPTMEWDTAAGQAILAAAGGTTTTMDGAPFRYAKPGFRNGNFLAKGC